ncbi:hypothetical protein GOB85_12310 [Acetobacter sp. LMG 1636]|uniref:Uncharacterized protein n=1 Tax=Acetobacter fallax TaxID=1737473 RepID=A0ABX0KDU9_9PROT|nr:hypothetical protein [Acetobacter fallax]NHO36886.1 hypothetical protein [Acetobacter fallax]
MRQSRQAKLRHRDIKEWRRVRAWCHISSPALQTLASAITASRFAAALFFVKGQTYGLGG